MQIGRWIIAMTSSGIAAGILLNSLFLNFGNSSDSSLATSGISSDVQPIEEVSVSRYKNDYQSAVSVLIEAAGHAMQVHAFTTPIENNAFQLFSSVLILDPDNTEAKKGIEDIKNNYVYFLDQAFKRNNTLQVKLYLKKAKSVGVSTEVLAKYDETKKNQSGLSGERTTGISKVRRSGASAEEIANSLELRTMGQALQEKKQFSLAIPVYQQLVELNQQNSADWLGLAVSLDADGRSEPAKKAYQNVILLKHSSDQVIAFSQQRINEISLTADK